MESYVAHNLNVKAGFKMEKCPTKSFYRLSQQSLAFQGLPSSSRSSGRGRIWSFPRENHLSPLRAPQQLP